MEPGLAVIGGPNGCGKTTLATTRSDLLYGVSAINPDELTKRVRADFPSINPDERER